MFFCRHVLLLFFIILYTQLRAQETVPLFLGTKTTYHPLQHHYTPAPVGFQPVFINYVGRHGARFLTKPGSDVSVSDILQQAADNNGLRETGKAILHTVEQFNKAEKGNYENITLSGADEQAGIAKRMYNDYRNVFENKQIESYATTKVRTQQSAKAFLQGFPEAINKNINTNIIADSVDTLLRFYDMSPAYDKYKQNESIQKHLDSLQRDDRMNEVANRIAHKIFTTSFFQQLSANKIIADFGSGKKKTVDKTAFAEALYDLYTIWFSSVEEIQKTCSCKPINTIRNAFTNTDLQWLDLMNNAEDFYMKGPAENTAGIQIIISKSLLENFVQATDSVVNGSTNKAAILRFTHAEAISPLATLLGIPQASQESFSVYEFQKQWQASQIIPLSANIQWILYRNGTKYLLKVLLNEKEVALPLPTNRFPYYDWKIAKEYYNSRLKKISAE